MAKRNINPNTWYIPKIEQTVRSANEVTAGRKNAKAQARVEKARDNSERNKNSDVFKNMSNEDRIRARIAARNA